MANGPAILYRFDGDSHLIARAEGLFAPAAVDHIGRIARLDDPMHRVSAIVFHIVFQETPHSVTVPFIVIFLPISKAAEPWCAKPAPENVRTPSTRAAITIRLFCMTIPPSEHVTRYIDRIGQHERSKWPPIFSPLLFVVVARFRPGNRAAPRAWRSS